jgi:glutaconate CoA-transferase subunit B
MLVRVHPGVSTDDARAATAWDLKIAPDLDETKPPTATELEALRALGTKGRE